jgi:hypothetical protein
VPVHKNTPAPQHCWKFSIVFFSTSLGIFVPVFGGDVGNAPDIRPDNPAFFDIRYPAGYRIALPDIR